jgi:uncharacterized cupredoxin-like copper-binding protein
MLILPAAGPNFAASGTPTTGGVSSAVIAFRLPGGTAPAAGTPVAAEAAPTMAPAAPTATTQTMPAAGASPAAQATAGPTVDMIDIAFSPNEITIPANTPTTVHLVNRGAAVHTFNIDELNVQSGDYAPGQEGDVTINAPAGTYQYYCNIPGHREAGMVGNLIVK